MLLGFVKVGGILTALLFLVPGLILVSVFGVLEGPFPAQDKVEWEHGVTLPPSANVLHRENSGVPLSDSSAVANVSMDTRDLPTFLGQLQPPRPGYRYPGVPWKEVRKDGTRLFRCKSNSSDGQMFVTVPPPNHGKVTVKLETYTD